MGYFTNPVRSARAQARSWDATHLPSCFHPIYGQITVLPVWLDSPRGNKVKFMNQSHRRQFPDEGCLETYKVELRATLTRLASAHPDGEIAVQRVSEPMDQIALACERSLALNRLEWSSFLTRQVSEALKRMDDGTYGLCLQCDRPIAAKRLAALPWAAFCVACQEAFAEKQAFAEK
jgi:DnaK suppressor protein